jgi:hypothetical protein
VSAVHQVIGNTTQTDRQTDRLTHLDVGTLIAAQLGD